MSNNNTSYKDLLTQKDFIKLTTANTLGQFGDSIVALAFVWLMYEITGSAALMAVNFMIRSIPDVVFQPIAGAIVDKLPKKRVLLLCKITRMTIMLTMAFLVITSMVTVPILFAFTFLCATIEAIRNPASIAITPLVLDKDKYATGSGIKASLWRVADLLGTAVAGALIITIGTAGSILVSASTFMVAAIIVALVKLKEAKSTERINLGSTKTSLKEGLAYMKTSHVFVWLLVLGMLLNAMLVPFSAFSVVYIVDYLYGGPGFLSAVKISLSLAAIVGAIATPKIKKFSYKWLIVISGFIMGLAMLLFSLAPMVESIAWRQGSVILIILFAGVALGVINVVFGTVFMQHIDKDFLGRMGGLTNSATSFAMPVVAGICALLAAVVSVPNVFFVSGIAIVVLFCAVARVKVYNRL